MSYKELETNLIKELQEKMDVTRERHSQGIPTMRDRVSFKEFKEMIERATGRKIIVDHGICSYGSSL